MAESVNPLMPDGRLSRSALEQLGQSTSRQESLFGGMPRLNIGVGEGTTPGVAESFWIRIDAVGAQGQYSATEVIRTENQAAGTLDSPPGDPRVWNIGSNPVYEANLSTDVPVGSIKRAWNSGWQGIIEFDAGGTPSTPGPCINVVTGVCLDGGNLKVEKTRICFPAGTIIGTPVCVTNPSCDDLCPACTVPNQNWQVKYPTTVATWVYDPLVLGAGDPFFGGNCCPVVFTFEQSRTMLYCPSECQWLSDSNGTPCSTPVQPVCWNEGPPPLGDHGSAGAYGSEILYHEDVDTWFLFIGISFLGQATYSIPGASFNPTGSNVMTLVDDTGTSCTGWPATITINPG